ncbi:hypothetical protein [Sphaerothrix gracilis]|uniref:hypothetical protein n=1 Tax=Sphaerothrix gracilis TaxID=3151835 RepID=UPI0031FC3C3A
MQEDTPLSGVINRLKHLRQQDRRNAAEAYAAAADLANIAEHALETSTDLIEEFKPEAQVALPDNVLSDRLQEIDALKKSQQGLQQLNDSYRVQRELTLQLLKERGIDPKVIAEVEGLNDRRSRSIDKRIALFGQQTGWERSKIIGLFKKYLYYTKIE